MHMAVVTASLPDPPDTTGRLRVIRLASALARHGTVQLFSALTGEDLVAEAKRAGSGLAPFSRVVTHGMEAPTGLRRWAEPLDYASFPDALVTAIAAADEVHPFDVVVLGSAAAGKAIEKMPRAAVVLDLPRLESVARERRLRGSKLLLPRRLARLHGWRMLEERLFRRADAITAARVSDIPLVHTYRPDTCVHVPNGVDAGMHAYRSPSQRTGNTLLFAGPLWYEPNVVSAVALAKQVLPQVRRLIPDATLTIAGRSPGRRVRQLESDHVRVVGMRTSMVALFEDHAVFAVPPVAGRVPEARLLDAFVSGMPVVTSADALPDPAAVPDRHFVSAHAPLEMAHAIVRVLSNRDRYDGMGLAASRLAARYDWELVGETFSRVVLAAAERRRT